MNLAILVEKGFRKFIPSPFTLAVILSLFILSLAIIFKSEDQLSAWNILEIWQNGMWEPSLIVFAVQMMLILVLGHILVLSKPVSAFINKLTSFINSNTTAVVTVAVSTMLVSFFNWGLGLIFGAIMARKVGEIASEKKFPINYPLMGAAGYSGLMVWHGGISGSAPLKVAENGHLKSLLSTESETNLSSSLPENIPTDLTIFSSWNLILFAIVVITITSILFIISRKTASEKVTFEQKEETISSEQVLKGADKLDHSGILKFIFGILLLEAFFASYWNEILRFNLTPNMLNFLMLGLCILLHKNFVSFLKALDEAIVGAGAILIQFPIYFGIMAVMRETGMINDIALFFGSIATETTLPLYNFFSAGLVNIFVPSGGGQWAIQGPIILQTATELNVPLNKAVMAFAYGDQITNMLQPFWALPLLAITKLKAREILPYTLLMMFGGIVVYLLGLLII